MGSAFNRWSIAGLDHGSKEGMGPRLIFFSGSNGLARVAEVNFEARRVISLITGACVSEYDSLNTAKRAHRV